MQYIIDILLLAIVIIALIIGIKRGFARSILTLVAFFLTIFLSFELATPIASKTYDALIAPRVAKKIEETLNTKGIGKTDPLEAITESLPSVLRPYAKKQSQDILSAFHEAKSKLGNNSQIGTAVEEKVIHPIAVKVFAAIFFFVIAIILGAVLQFFAITIAKAFKLPLIQTVDSTLGGIAGLLYGSVFAFAAALFLLFLATQISGPFQEAVAASKIIAFLQSHLSSMMTF